MGLGLYLHFPFCEKKCNYCDFLSYPLEHLAEGPADGPAETGGARTAITSYLQALETEMRLYSSLAVSSGHREAIDSVYLGGGTPTILTAEQLVQVLEKCQDFFTWSQDVEVTVEANPGTVDLDKLHRLKAAGVNRISFGVQSFDDVLLQTMGRIHSAAEAVQSLALAREAGFANINVDLMFGLPGQTLTQWEETVAQALELDIPHFSVYGLKVERNTVWGREMELNMLSLPKEEVVIKMRDLADQKFSWRGFSHYEISNYARPGREARHNLKYWSQQNYLGLGLGASSHLRPRRWTNTRERAVYLQLLQSGQLPIATEELLSHKQQMGEAVFLALRLARGIEAADFQARFGITLEKAYGRELEELLKLGLLKKRGHNYSLTPQGARLANYVFACFV